MLHQSAKRFGKIGRSAHVIFNGELGGFTILYLLAMWISDMKLIAGTKMTGLD